MNTSELMALLRERYPKDAYAFFTEVPNGTGSNCGRHCDALAMSLWPSRGLHLNGFELKVSRADWLKELKQPAKADSIARYCDFWWLVVADEKIVHLGELPATWGLMIPIGGKLKVKTQPTQLESNQLSRSFLAGLFRVAQAQITKEAEVEALKTTEYLRGRKIGVESMQYEVDSLKKLIAEFEGKSGVKLDRYNVGRIVDAMRLVQDGLVVDTEWKLKEIRSKATRIIEAIDEDLKAKR